MNDNKPPIVSTVNDWSLILFLPTLFVFTLVTIGFWNEWEPLIPVDYQTLSMIPFGILYFCFTYCLIKIEINWKSKHKTEAQNDLSM
ncbi:hypothetical protein Pan241w_49700 [Gimesia alba]|uniref:Uncharacterized protein n=1 Tax=Gimesia alba TaxID=2527973 RepID=A0A517RLU7_9PLAN|nr:hypothetical protein Pan241w_49700 [Gimesia alba]